MTLKPMIWAKQTIMLWKESVSWEWMTTSTVNVLFPKISWNLEPKTTFVSDDAAHWTIVQSFAERLVDAYTDISLNGNLSFTNVRTLIAALTWSDWWTWWNTYTLVNNNTHPTYVITQVTWDYLENWWEIEIYSAAYSAMNTFWITANTNDFVKFDTNFLWSKPEEVTTTNLVNRIKSQLASEQARDTSANVIDFSQIKMYLAEANSVSAFNTMIDWDWDNPWTLAPLNISSLSLNFNKNVEQVWQIWTYAKEAYNKQFSIDWSFEKLKFQDSFNYEDNVNKDLMMRIDFYNLNKTEIVFSILLGKVNLSEKTTSDWVWDLVSENITFKWLFSWVQAETLIISTTNLSDYES